MSQSNSAPSPTVLGPFLGFVDSTSAKIWLHDGRIAPSESKDIYVTLHPGQLIAPATATAKMHLDDAGLNTGIASFENLLSGQLFFYRIWTDENCSVPFELDGLHPEQLHFKTLPEAGYEDRLDFLLMSCHDPESGERHGLSGFAVWSAIPQIIRENENVRLAAMCGDQVYADAFEDQLLQEPDLRKRQELYLQAYRKAWSNLAYRRVLCSLPSVLIWDDHDITDGWGSRFESFTDAKSSAFKPEWLRMFESARSVFHVMQAARNPEPLSADAFDTCFRIGRAGFVLADLRSHRNARAREIWKPAQLEAIKKRIDELRPDLDVLFFVSPVVFSHGDPHFDNIVTSLWGLVLKAARWLGTTRFAVLRAISNWFRRDVDDLRDDVTDSWASEVNADEADRVLDFLFGLQNPVDGKKPLTVVVLSGDIHTPGYSTLYSARETDAEHPVIPHIVASPISYQPFSWQLEALYRHATKAVQVGKKGIYTAQISHHYCHRNVAVVSLRHVAADTTHLKVKYYLEGFPEPQIMLFDLSRGSHREAIAWEQESKQAAQAPRPA